MYWSIHGFPDLAGRPRAERQAILQAALKRHGRVSGLRLLIVIAGVVVGTIAASVRLSRHASLLDWRTWIAPAAAALFIYAYLLVAKGFEAAGARWIHVVAGTNNFDKNGASGPKRT